MTPLRILHTESSHGWGGQEIRTLTEARGMQDRGHDVVIATVAEAELLPAARKLGLRTVVLPMRRKGWVELLRVRAWLAEHHHRFDIINTHSSTDSWLTALSCATLTGTPPLLRTRHVSTTVNKGLATRWLYCKAAAHIVTTGEALRQQLHRDNAFPLAHMTSVRTGIDLQRFRPLNKIEMRRALGVPDKFVIGILATLRDWKGHDYLLDALVALRQKFHDVHLLIVGDGPRRSHLESRVRQLQLGECVSFVGNQDNAEQWLATFDIFTLPSYGEEGVPQAIMQAMACGLPVISTPIGAIPEAVSADRTGLLIEPRSAIQLAEAIERLLRAPELRQQLSAAALEHAHAHFGIDQMLDEMEAVLHRTIQRR